MSDETRSYNDIFKDNARLIDRCNDLEVENAKLRQANHPDTAVYQRNVSSDDIDAESAWIAGAQHVADTLNNLTNAWDIPLDVELGKAKMLKEFEVWKAKQKS